MVMKLSQADAISVLVDEIGDWQEHALNSEEALGGLVDRLNLLASLPGAKNEWCRWARYTIGACEELIDRLAAKRKAGQ